VKNAEMAVREISALKRGTVRLGVGPTTLTYRLPSVLAVLLTALLVWSKS
jgi:hypothetical protein